MIAQELIAGVPGAAGEQPPLRLDSAQSYLERVVSELRAKDADDKGPLVSVLEYLSQHIRWTREQIGGLRLGNVKPNPLAATADQLEEVVGETAKAANDIMSAAEQIERLAAKAAPDISAAIGAQVTRIYEASAFQDITGQRITKVVGALQSMEVRIVELIEACGPMQEAPPAFVSQDEKLLNGPQLSGNASPQQEIDRLFGGG